MAATVAVFTVARPAYREAVAMAPDDDLPYTEVVFTSADAKRAFAAENITLTSRSRSAWITTLGNRGDVLAVDTFGDPERVKQAGFHDYTLVDGRYVRFPRNCEAGSGAAALWRGNVRVTVNCIAAAGASGTWLRRAKQALARL